MTLTYQDAIKALSAQVGRPTMLLVANKEQWGLPKGAREAVVFDWGAIEPALYSRFLGRVFRPLVTNKSFIEVRDGLYHWVNDDVLPFALFAKERLHERGCTFEAVCEAPVEGALMFDLQHGPEGKCPVLLWDMRRFSKVAADSSQLSFQAGAAQAKPTRPLPRESNPNAVWMPQRTFVRAVGKETRYWQVSVDGRRVTLHRGLLSAGGQKDWTSNETKVGEAATPLEALEQAKALIKKYLVDGYTEREGFGDAAFEE